MPVLARCLLDLKFDEHWPVWIFITLLLYNKVCNYNQCYFYKECCFYICPWMCVSCTETTGQENNPWECHPISMLLRWRGGREFRSSHLCLARKALKMMRVKIPAIIYVKPLLWRHPQVNKFFMQMDDRIEKKMCENTDISTCTWSSVTEASTNNFWGLLEAKCKTEICYAWLSHDHLFFKHSVLRFLHHASVWET